MWEQGATRGRRSQKHGHEWGAVAQRKFPHLITLKRVDADSNQLYGRLVQISDGEVRNWPLGQQVESHFPLEQR